MIGDAERRPAAAAPLASDGFDLAVEFAPRPAQLEAGLYYARSVRLERFDPGQGARERGWSCKLILWFETYDRNPAEGPAKILATLPMYARIPAGERPRIPAGSKLARVFDLLAHADPRRGRRPDRVPLSGLRHRLWRVQVVDVRRDAAQRRLTEARVYSVVQDVVEHLA